MLLQPDAWVEVRVREIYEEVCKNKDKRNHNRKSLHNWVIPVENAFDHARANTWQGEDGLGQYRAREQASGLNSDDGDDRYQGIAQGMFTHHQTITQSLG